MKFFRYCWGTAFCILIAALFFGCSSPIQNAEKLAMTDPESAIAAYKNIMQQKPNSDEAKMAHLGMADTYYKRLEDQEKGLEIYEEIAKAYPDTKYSGEAHWAIAMHYFQAKDYESARDNFAKVTQDMPGTEKASDAALAIAKCYEELKKFDEAAKMYSEFSKNHASHRRAAQAGLDAARIYDRELNKPEMAVEEYKHVASEYALSSSGREARETLEERGVEVADVTELVEEEEPETQQPQTTMNRGGRRRRRATNVPRAQIGGTQRVEEQRAKSVSEDFGVDPLDLMPIISGDSQGTMYDAMFMFANMNLQSHQYKEAGALYEKAIELAGNNPWKQAGAAYFGLAKSYKGIGMDEKATEMFKKAIKEDRKIIDSMITTGETYYSDGDYEEALDAYKIALGLVPHKDSEIYYKMGLVYKRLGNDEEEMESFERSVALKPSNNDDAIQHLAEVLYYRIKDATRAELYDKEARNQGNNDYKVQMELGDVSYKYDSFNWAKIKYNNAARIVLRDINNLIKSEITTGDQELAAQISEDMTNIDLKAVSEAAAAGNELASSILSKLSELIDDYRYIMSRMILSQIRLEQYDNARKEIDEFLATDPNAAESADYHFAVGMLAMAQGDQEVGMAEVKKALEIDPEHKGAAEVLGQPTAEEMPAEEMTSEETSG